MSPEADSDLRERQVRTDKTVTTATVAGLLAVVGAAVYAVWRSLS
jgi:hypothetical protein